MSKEAIFRLVKHGGDAEKLRVLKDPESGKFLKDVDEFGMPLIHYVAMTDNPEVHHLILERRELLGVKTSNGNTTAHVVAGYGAGKALERIAGDMRLLQLTNDSRRSVASVVNERAPGLAKKMMETLGNRKFKALVG